jgi:predicted ATPase
MIGREDELTRLRSAFRRALRSESPVRVTVVGDAGIGKSRLAREVIASLAGDAHAIVLRCTPPGDGMGFHPVRQAVVEAAGVVGWRGLHALLETAADGESAVDEIGTAIALRCPPATADELVAPMRRLLETLASHHPLVVVVDDLHWSDSSFIELLDRLEREATAHALLLCLARPDLYEADKKSIPRDTIRLESLSSSEVARLVIDRGGPTGQGALHRIVNLSQGNPLFAEQLLAATDDGEIAAIPASLVGLLSMRLDRLGPGERNILRGASVVGLDCDLDVLRDLLPEEARPFVERHIEALERKRFIQRSGSGGFRFAHALIQMAAYQSMTREDRARLHAAFADRPERERSDPASELTGDGPQPAGPTRPSRGRPGGP